MESQPATPTAEWPVALYLVATPIGNLGDITLRALEALRRADVIACEDTRHTAKLLGLLALPNRPLLSLHDHNEAARSNEIVHRLQQGQRIALVSDAGTPTISDPGFRVVRACRAAGLPVIPLPGPCALIAALSASGLPTDAFRFGGFLPPKSAARIRLWESLRDSHETLIFYESTHRITKALDELVAVLGDRRVIAVGREITKRHEAFHCGPAAAVRDAVASASTKGEFVVMVAKAEFTWP
jgi:16S rRNA (cytidine1402-2'-O)-methyltransferase